MHCHRHYRPPYTASGTTFSRACHHRRTNFDASVAYSKDAHFLRLTKQTSAFTYSIPAAPVLRRVLIRLEVAYRMPAVVVADQAENLVRVTVSRATFQLCIAIRRPRIKRGPPMKPVYTLDAGPDFGAPLTLDRLLR
jgi:hypothetical protein